MSKRRQSVDALVVPDSEDRMIFLKPEIKQGTRSEFVDVWSQQYQADDALYDHNITRPLTAEKILDLFVWKNGSVLSALKKASVEMNFVNQMDVLAKLPADLSAADFLSKFPSGGAIWRIFWLHCWQPDRFPIYDMHVHRAMKFIETTDVVEIPSKDSEKVASFIDEYLPFHAKFTDAPRDIDKALWAYGKFLKGYRVPPFLGR